ncbi:hypothetical protein EOD41_05750 [Mucilaginibacter limnophilus]|uniref:Uncharacterized protein n=1 Tax=Mucilaginibacter limnophilus TaxID=1932778 RepID=A0A3S2V8V3_9SPHI|nr:hypothetical protein [Mucilaginibacter limnophilus]RVU01467.1 hypothetical protein EOD41_05750 [Mucilaginibacter limnophilus]
MAKRLLLIIFSLLFTYVAKAQQIQRFNPDTVMTIVIDSAVNINSHRLNAQDFIDAVTRDTSFYKAFRDMKRYSFLAENRIVTYDKKNKINGKIYRKIRHTNKPGSHKVEYLAKSDSGSLYKKNGKYQLYTVEMFDYIFGNAYNSDFTNAPASGGSGKNASYKSKLKTLIFRPGTKVKGIPFISSKTEIFSPELREFYNYQFARGTYLDSIPVYRFKVTRKPSTAPGDVMINEMTTIFDTRTFEILGRYIDMKFNNMFASFNVQMNIELNRFNSELLPVKISYQGNWDVPFHKEERAGFLILHKEYKEE